MLKILDLGFHIDMALSVSLFQVWPFCLHMSSHNPIARGGGGWGLDGDLSVNTFLKRKLGF